MRRKIGSSSAISTALSDEVSVFTFCFASLRSRLCSAEILFMLRTRQLLQVLTQAGHFPLQQGHDVRGAGKVFAASHFFELPRRLRCGARAQVAGLALKAVSRP